MELLPKQLWNRAKRYVSLIRSVTEDPSEARARIVFSQISDYWSSVFADNKCWIFSARDKRSG